MSLLKLIRKQSVAAPATATAATIATEPAGAAEAVAKVAEVAVATGTLLTSANTRLAYEVDEGTVSSWWKVCFATCAPKVISCSPAFSAAEMKACWISSIGVEVYTPVHGRPLAPMTVDDETRVRAGLAYMYVTNPVAIDEIIARCQSDADVRMDYLMLADEIPDPDDFSDERRLCSQCRNWLPDGRCAAAARGELNASRTYMPVSDVWQRCAGYSPGPDDPDQRTGWERRWPA